MLKKRLGIEGIEKSWEANNIYTTITKFRLLLLFQRVAEK